MVTLRQKRGGLKHYNKHNATIKVNSESISVLQEWYHSLYLSHAEWKRNKTRVMLSKIKKVETPSMVNIYIPKPIVSFIQTKTLEQNTFVFQINDQTITVILYLYSTDQLTDAYQQKCLECIYTWIHFIQPYRQEKCSNQLTISLYLTPFKKQLPARQNEMIDTTHVNTAFTYACIPENTINIFRHEEWSKVLFHETFHALGIDFSHMDTASNLISSKVQARFHLQSPPAVYEAYTELCAEIMHLVYVALTTSKKITLNANLFYDSLNKELDYSFYQCAKILNHYRTNYEEVSQSSTHTYKDKKDVHVFSYFLLKTMLLFSFDDFIHYIKENGGFCFECSKRTVSDKIQHLYEIITNAADNPIFMKEMQIKERSIKRTTRNPYSNDIKRKTLRMISV